MIISGYLDGFVPPVVPSTLVPSEIGSSDLFWPAFLCTVGTSASAPYAFGSDPGDLDEFVDSLVDPSRWPVFTLPLAGDSLLHIVLRNFEDDSGVDYLLEPSPGRDVIQLAALDGHFRGPALAWPELVAAAAQPDPDHTPAERLLLLLPVCADSDRPGVAADVVAKALTAVGARSRVRQVSEELLADGPYRAPAEWITLEGIRYCHGKHAYRSFAGELTLADLRAVTEAFTLPAGWGPSSAGRAGGVVV